MPPASFPELGPALLCLSLIGRVTRATSLSITAPNSSPRLWRSHRRSSGCSPTQTLGECHKWTESAKRKRPEGPVRTGRLSSAPLCSGQCTQRLASSPAVGRTLGHGVFTEDEHRLWRDSVAYLAKLAVCLESHVPFLENYLLSQLLGSSIQYSFTYNEILLNYPHVVLLQDPSPSRNL